MEDWRGQLVDGYRIRERLGEGSLGVTYRAFHPVERTDVVFKVLADYLNQQQEVLTQFQELATQLKLLEHPGIVQAMRHGVWREQTFLVTAFIPGPSLRQVLAQAKAPMAWVDFFQIARQVAAALLYVHEQGLYHLSLRPENVLFAQEQSESSSRQQEPGYQAVLTDLSVRKILEASFQEGSQSDHPLVLAYLSPEQCVASQISTKTDVYTFGIMLYEMIAGEVPFRTPTVADAVAMHMKAVPKQVSQHRIDVPPGIEELVMAMLAKPSRDRPEMTDVAARLDAAGDDLGLRQGSSWDRFAGPAIDVQRRATRREPEPPAPTPGPWKTTGPAELHISRRGEQTQVVPLVNKKRFVIGRDSRCDITLNDRRVSRRHCEIRWEDDQATILDLGSNNGTYMERAKLIPHQPEALHSGTAIRIPPFTLRLEAVERAPQPALPQPPDEKAPLDSIGKTASVSLSDDNIEATPGGAPGVLIVNLQNLSRIVDWFSPHVFGIPSDWISGTDQEVRLNPGQQGNATLNFRPPPEPSTTAGSHPVQILIHSREQDTVVAKADMVLQVASFSRLETELTPSQIESRTRATMQITVTNRGNSLAHYTVSAKDDAQVLMFEIEPEEMDVPPAATRVSQVTVAPRKPSWIGRKQMYPFSVNVASDTGETRMVGAQFRQRSWLPAWLPMVLMLLCCGAAALAALAGPRLYEMAFPTATVTITPTGTLAPTPTLTLTPTPSPTPTPNLTATWEPLDNDHDGLENGDEITRGTEPDIADTDGDGLIDGEEVKLYSTNPLDKDSDKDTWTDGQEVQMAEERFGKGGQLCPEPNNPDSDADGLKDAVDPDPCDLPTPTPSVTPTTTPVPSFALGAHIAGNDHLDIAKQARMKWIKKQIRFNPGDTAAALAEDLNTWHNEGFNILLGVVGSREHIAGGAAYYDQYAAYVGELAGAGVDAIEIWNEMNIDREWPTGQISPTAYVELLRRASAAIRANGPGVLVISGALAPTGFDDNTTAWGDKRYLEGIAAAGAGNYVDCIGVHHNAGATSPSERSGHPADDGAGHHSWYFLPQTELYHNTFDGAVPLCYTELGYLSPEGYGALGAGFAWATDTSVQEQAQWLGEAVSLARDSGMVKLVIVWNLDFQVYSEEDPQAGYAILRPDDSCPACGALAGAVP